MCSFLLGREGWTSETHRLSLYLHLQRSQCNVRLRGRAGRRTGQLAAGVAVLGAGCEGKRWRRSKGRCRAMPRWPPEERQSERLRKSWLSGTKKAYATVIPPFV